MDALVATAAEAVELVNGGDAVPDPQTAFKSLRSAADDWAAENARNMEIGEINEADRRSAADSIVKLLGGRLNGGRTTFHSPLSITHTRAFATMHRPYCTVHPQLPVSVRRAASCQLPSPATRHSPSQHPSHPTSLQATADALPLPPPRLHRERDRVSDGGVAIGLNAHPSESTWRSVRLSMPPPHRLASRPTPHQPLLRRHGAAARERDCAHLSGHYDVHG